MQPSLDRLTRRSATEVRMVSRSRGSVPAWRALAASLVNPLMRAAYMASWAGVSSKGAIEIVYDD